MSFELVLENNLGLTLKFQIDYGSPLERSANEETFNKVLRLFMFDLFNAKVDENEKNKREVLALREQVSELTKKLENKDFDLVINKEKEQEILSQNKKVIKPKTDLIVPNFRRKKVKGAKFDWIYGFIKYTSVFILLRFKLIIDNMVPAL